MAAMPPNEVTLTLTAPEGCSAAFFFTLLQIGAGDAVDRAAAVVFQREEAGEDSSIARRHYNTCKAYRDEVDRAFREFRGR